jgi:hypothetical protein
MNRIRRREKMMGKAIQKGIAAARCATVVGLGCLIGTTAWADGPEVGVNVGAAFPLDKY